MSRTSRHPLFAGSFVALSFLCSCATLQRDIAPQTTLPTPAGVFVVSPDENGWILFNPSGGGTAIVKHGPTKLESYGIDARSITVPKSRSCEKEFPAAVKLLTAMDPNRFTPRLQQVEADSSRGANFVNYYVLVEDHGAHGMPKDQSFALFEVMGLMGCHPYNPDLLVTVDYSYRYYPGHDDPEFKKKAKWVLDRVTFKRP